MPQRAGLPAASLLHSPRSDPTGTTEKEAASPAVSVSLAKHNVDGIRLLHRPDALLHSVLRVSLAAGIVVLLVGDVRLFVFLSFFSFLLFFFFFSFSA